MAESISKKEWRDKISRVIKQKCALPDSNLGCIKWEGALFQPAGYGKVAIQLTNKRRKYFRVHRLVFLIHHKLQAIPTQNDQGIRVEVSHICHQRLCVKPEHLTLEAHEVNMERLHCKKQGFCTKNHQPYCLLVSFREHLLFLHLKNIFA